MDLVASSYQTWKKFIFTVRRAYSYRWKCIGGRIFPSERVSFSLSLGHFYICTFQNPREHQPSELRVIYKSHIVFFSETAESNFKFILSSVEWARQFSTWKDWPQVSYSQQMLDASPTRLAAYGEGLCTTEQSSSQGSSSSMLSSTGSAALPL